MAQQTATRPRTLKRPILWVAAVLMLAGVPVQVTGVGIDLFALIFVAASLFVIERTAGDAVAEFIGPIGTAVLFCVVAAAGFGYMLTESGQVRAKRFFAAAEARGYEPLYLTADRTQGQKGPDPSVARPPVGLTHESPSRTPTVDVARNAATSERPPSEPSSAPPAEGTVVSTSFFSRWTSSEVPLARLTVSPPILAAGEIVNIEVRFIGTHVMLKAPIVFFVDGREIGRADLDARGIAAARVAEQIPGTYQASVRLPAGTRATTPGVVSFTVLPPHR
jgi:hypothetical protein